MSDSSVRAKSPLRPRHKQAALECVEVLANVFPRSDPPDMRSFDLGVEDSSCRPVFLDVGWWRLDPYAVEQDADCIHFLPAELVAYLLPGIMTVFLLGEVSGVSSPNLYETLTYVLTQTERIPAYSSQMTVAQIEAISDAIQVMWEICGAYDGEADQALASLRSAGFLWRGRC